MTNKNRDISTCVFSTLFTPTHIDAMMPSKVAQLLDTEAVTRGRIVVSHLYNSHRGNENGITPKAKKNGIIIAQNRTKNIFLIILKKNMSMFQKKYHTFVKSIACIKVRCNERRQKAGILGCKLLIMN